MNLFTILFLAVGLAMDAFAVSIASGIAFKRFQVSHALRIAVFFGLFQALMPMLGWLAGLTLKDYIESVDHWIAFGLLSAIGFKMIYESALIEKEEKGPYQESLYMLLMLSVATSIDALAVGLSLSIIGVDVFLPALVIGVVTFALSFLGVFIGNRMGHLFERKIELLGGIILIGIGVKILAEHLRG